LSGPRSGETPGSDGPQPRAGVFLGVLIAVTAAAKLAASLGIADHVDFLGEQDLLVPLLSIADVFLLPSVQESFGLAALEAMACSVPVVASRIGGLPEVIEDGVTGFLHPPDDLDGHVLPRYAYSFGFVSSRDERNRFSAIGTVSAADAPFRVFFSEANQQFWDGLSVDTGDIRRDLRLAYRHEFGSNFAIDVATTAGTATPRQYSGDVQKVYVTGDLQTIFTPTRTMLAVSYRELQQPQTGRRGDYRSERVNMRMAQSLYLPIDVKVLLGIELARAENSPFLLDIRVPDQATKKYIGGLSLNF